jgi:hypothetical protein
MRTYFVAVVIMVSHPRLPNARPRAVALALAAAVALYLPGGAGRDLRG